MNRRSGFTLIELVVVIMILGILAGVAAPKFFNTSATATDNGLKQTLSIVRDAIELYNAQNNVAPHLAATGLGTSDFLVDLAPYLRAKIPASPVGAKNAQIKLSTSNPLAADAAPTTGYVYNATTGQFIVNCQSASANSGPTYETF